MAFYKKPKTFKKSKFYVCFRFLETFNIQILDSQLGYSRKLLPYSLISLFIAML